MIKSIESDALKYYKTFYAPKGLEYINLILNNKDHSNSFVKNRGASTVIFDNQDDELRGKDLYEAVVARPDAYKELFNTWSKTQLGEENIKLTFIDTINDAQSVANIINAPGLADELGKYSDTCSTITENPNIWNDILDNVSKSTLQDRVDNSKNIKYLDGDVATTKAISKLTDLDYKEYIDNTSLLTDTSLYNTIFNDTTMKLISNTNAFIDTALNDDIIRNNLFTNDTSLDSILTSKNIIDKSLYTNNTITNAFLENTTDKYTINYPNLIPSYNPKNQLFVYKNKLCIVSMEDYGTVYFLDNTDFIPMNINITDDNSVFTYSNIVNINDTLFYAKDNSTYWCAFDTTVHNYSGAFPRSTQYYKIVYYKGQFHILGSHADMGSSANPRYYPRTHYVGSGSSFVDLQDLPIDFYYGNAIVYKDKIHLIGGSGDASAHWTYNGIAWEAQQPLPFQAIYGATTVWNDEIHLIVNNMHYAYDGSSWRTIGTLPVNISSAQNILTTYNNQMYFYYSKRLYVFKNNQWELLVDNSAYAISTPASGYCYITLNNELYAFPQWTSKNRIYKYNKTSKTWATITNPADENPYSAVPVVFDGKIHLFGSEHSTYYRAHRAFDGTSWTSYANTPMDMRSGSSAVAYKNTIIIRRNSNNTTYKWNPSTDTWTSVSGTSYDYNSFAVYNNTLYAVMGSSSDGALVFRKYDDSTNSFIDVPSTEIPALPYSTNYWMGGTHNQLFTDGNNLYYSFYDRNNNNFSYKKLYVYNDSIKQWKIIINSTYFYSGISFMCNNVFTLDGISYYSNNSDIYKRVPNYYEHVMEV